MYEKLGFHAVSSVSEAEGLRFIQMQKAFTV
ncbi:GNAT family N-acetyltransferase [Acinetobacter pragensis]